MRKFRFRVIACVVTVICIATADAQTFTILHRFGFKTDGARSTGGLIFGPGDTELYGTTMAGGTNKMGTVFQISPSGRESVLYSFGNDPDGNNPSASLVRGPGGTLYGTTSFGGPHGFGTVFKLAKVGNTVQETTVYSFQGGTDGAGPNSGLVWDAAGNLYGTTISGGGTDCLSGSGGCGTVFKINAATGQETVLYAFKGFPDGENPPRGLVRDSVGNLYGTTQIGGASNYGTVFMVSANGQETILHSFTGPPDGAMPAAGLLRDAAGNLFGTTASGGNSNNFAECGPLACGTVFKVTNTGVESVLYNFSGSTNTDESFPFGGLVEDSAGNLYGTTAGAGVANSSCVTSGGCGTIFKLDHAGTLTTLHNFSFSDGASPRATMTMDGSGNLYGTTLDGGLSIGTVFKLTP
jgi:uncharacterized repeat protein (TIGR03803 family)